MLTKIKIKHKQMFTLKTKPDYCLVGLSQLTNLVMNGKIITFRNTKGKAFLDF